MQEFDNIKDMLYCEIEEISHQQKLDMNTVKVLGEIVDILKDIGSVEMFEEGQFGQDEEYSFSDGYSRNNGRYYRGNGSSYRSGGRSSRNGGSRSVRSNRSGYSRDDAKDHMIHKLERLMEEANDEQDRQSIERLIEQMENN